MDPARPSRHVPLLALFALGLPAWSQEPAPTPEPELPFQLDEPSPQEEIIRLFHEVEKTLVTIDVELADAGAGEIPLGEGQESGIDRLLRSTREKGDSAVAGIDRILELAQQLSGGT